MSECVSARLKLKRAHQHLNAFKRAFKRFSDKEPCTFRAEINSTRTQTTLYFCENLAFPPSLSLIIGDCIHNLRCALDHIAFQLPRAPGTDPRWEDWSQFPICDDSDRFAGCERYLRGVGGVWTIVEQLQPYYGGKDPVGHPLWYVRELSNRDKHRLTHVVSSVPTGGGVVVKQVPGFPPITGAVNGILTSGNLEHDAVVGKVYSTDPLPTRVQMDLSMQMGVVVENIGPSIGVEPMLELIHGYITNDVLPALEPSL